MSLLWFCNLSLKFADTITLDQILSQSLGPQLTNFFILPKSGEGEHKTTMYNNNWRASEASETLSGVYKFELVRYIYVWRYVCHNSSACHAYVMWAELVHCLFLYLPAVLNVVTTGNGTGTKNVLKSNHLLGFEFSIQSSVYGATTVAKVSLFSTWTQCTVSFYSM